MHQVWVIKLWLNLVPNGAGSRRKFVGGNPMIGAELWLWCLREKCSPVKHADDLASLNPTPDLGGLIFPSLTLNAFQRSKMKRSRSTIVFPLDALNSSPASLDGRHTRCDVLENRKSGLVMIGELMILT